MTPQEFRAIRKQLDLTQSEMGQRLGGYTKRTVASWEGGERNPPPAVCVLMHFFKRLEKK